MKEKIINRVVKGYGEDNVIFLRVQVYSGDLPAGPERNPDPGRGGAQGVPKKKTREIPLFHANDRYNFPLTYLSFSIHRFSPNLPVKPDFDPALCPRFQVPFRMFINPDRYRTAFCQKTSDNRLIEPAGLWVFKY